jgi:hypothetical protein
MVAWQILFLSLWKDFESRFVSIIDGLKKQRDFVDKEALSIDIVEAKDSRSRLQEEILQRQKQSLMLLEQNETNAGNSRVKDAVAWLSVDDRDQEEHYERVSRRRHDETCKWIMRENRIDSWVRNDTKYPVLWLNGKPGAGM